MFTTDFLKRDLGEIFRPLSSLKVIDFYWTILFFSSLASAFLMADMVNQLIAWRLNLTSRGFKINVSPPPSINRKSLFKIESQATKNLDINTPVSLPPFRLVGTVMGRGGPSFALFEQPNEKRQFLVMSGDTVSDGVILKGVKRGRVILSIGSREITLNIAYQKEKDEMKSGASTSKRLAEPGRGTVLDRRVVDNAIKNLNQVMTQARVVPYFVAGKPKGYRVFSIKPDSIYTMMGLKNGDIIQRINGVELTSPEKAYNLFLQLKDEPRITMDILRRGRRISMPVEVR